MKIKRRTFWMLIVVAVVLMGAAIYSFDSTQALIFWFASLAVTASAAYLFCTNRVIYPQDGVSAPEIESNPRGVQAWPCGNSHGVHVHLELHDGDQWVYFPPVEEQGLFWRMERKRRRLTRIGLKRKAMVVRAEQYIIFNDWVEIGLDQYGKEIF